MFFIKAFLTLGFISAVSIVLFEISLRLKGRRDGMRNRIYFVVGRESDQIWNITIESNSSTMSEEDALYEFKRKFGEDGYIYAVTEMDDDE